MAKSERTEQELGLLRAALSNPQVIEQWLDEMQYTACAGLIRFPELAKGTTAHIFSGADPLYVEVYRAVNAGNHGLVDVFVSISRRQHSAKSALALAALACHPVSRGEASRTIARLKKFVAWQYRQEKAKKVAK